MVTQFNPKYRITIYTNKKTIIIEDPITSKATITRNVLSDTNTANIQIYNLAPSTREEIYQDQYYNYYDQTKHKYIQVEGGWEDNTPLIFKGRILQAYPYKGGGQTDVVMEIEAIPFDIFTSQSSKTFEAGTNQRDALKALASDLPNVIIGAIGNFNGTFETPTTFSGNTYEQINKLTGGHSFVDNGVLNTLLTNEVLKVPVPVIADDVNLLETPRRRDTYLEIKTLFLPELLVGQLVEIKSGVYEKYNGQYKLVGFTHDCLFSKTQAGTRITRMVLSYGTLLPNSNIALTGASNPKTDAEEKPTGGAAPTNMSPLVEVERENVSPVNPMSPLTNWIMPCNGRITSGYGKRKAPVLGASKDHKGIDIGVPIGTPVKAIADGKVIAAGEASGYGRWVKIDHGKVYGRNVTSEYGHISVALVQEGTAVKQGQTIARSGNAGIGSGAHLHLTIKQDNKAVNPFNYIRTFNYPS